MIKVYTLITVIFVSSCTSIDYTYFNNIKNTFARNEINVTESFIKNFEYSFIKVSYKKNDAIFVLARVLEDGSYEWIGANYEVIITKSGTIIETIGLESDIKFHESQLPDFKNFKTSSHYIDLYNPNLVFEKLSFNYLDTKLPVKDLNYDQVITIQRVSETIGWHSKDIYFYNKGAIKRSIQKINPLKPPIEITFFFKY